MQKQLINVVGALILVLVLGLGIVLGAVPNSSQTGKTHAEADQVAQTNDVYDVQVQSLREQKKKLPELEANLAELRAEIPVREFNDQVFELVVNAAAATASTIDSAGAAEFETWTDPVVEATAADAAPEPEPAAEGTDAAADAPVDPATAAEAPTAPAVDESKVTVPFTVTVISPTMAQAMAFVDALKSATRLVRIERVTLALEEPAPGVDEDAPLTPPTVKVTVTLRSLVLTEN